MYVGYWFYRNIDFSLFFGSKYTLAFIQRNVKLNLLFFLYFLIIQAEVKKSRHEPCSLEIFLDHLKDIDFHPLLDTFMELDASEIQAVDVRNESSCVFNGECALSLMRAINQKLRRVEIQDLSFGKEFLRYILVLSLYCL